MATLAELEQEVRDTTDNLASEVDGRVNEYLQLAQEEAEDRHIFLAMETELAATTVLATRLLAAKPARWLRRLDLPVWLAGDTGKQVAFQWAATKGQLQALYSASTDAIYRGAPRHLFETETELHVYPLPDQRNTIGAVDGTGNYPVRVPYATRFALLDDPTDTHWLTERGRPYMVARAAGEAFFQNRDYDAAQLWIGRARSHLERLIRFDKRQRFHQAESFTPLAGGRQRAGHERPWR